VSKIKDIPKVDRPREKFLKKGPEALSKSDLLAILLGSGIKGKNVQKLSQQIIKKFSKTFLDVTVKDLQTVDGIGSAKALQIVAAISLVKRFYADEKTNEIIIKNSQDVLSLTYDLRDKKKEYLVCLYLDARNVLIKKEIISIGLVDKTLFHPREIFEPAFRLNASSIILAHNHPTGNPNPGSQDKEIVNRISYAGKINGIEVIDFIIVAGSNHYSFYKELGGENKNSDYIADGEVQGILFDLLEIEKPAYEMNIEKNVENNIANKPTYIDLFAGAGGFSLGFDNAGFKNIFSLDIEKNFCETYKTNFPNHKLIEKDISKLTDREIKNIVRGNKIDVIIGGPPCQGFSIAGNIGRKFIDDRRNHLFKEFIRVVDIIQPNYFVMENVARLYTHNNGETRKEIVLNFKNIGYNVECKILNSADYGVPQIRKRIIFIGSKINNKILFPQKNVKDYKTVENALSDLPILKSGDKSNIENHIAMNHSKQMLEKMNYISDGGDRMEIPIGTRPKSGDVRKYIKYISNKPSITITGDMRKVFHYSQNRALTVRELARLQSFPDSFIFKSTAISQQQQVGNAVPPLMAKAIANNLKEMFAMNTDKKKNDKIKFQNKFPKINFIGNKEKIANWICDHFPKETESVFDAFSGGCSVSYEAKKRGYKIITNDILYINYLLSKSLIENNQEILMFEDIKNIFSGKPFQGFMYKNYSNIFFFPEECMELDLYRKNIENLSSDYKKTMALSLLRRAMIRKMPYSRFNINWDKIKQLRNEEYSYKKYKRKRAYHNESFKYHFLENLDDYNNAVFDNKKNNESYNEDVFSILNNVSSDVVYLDPPYTGTMNNYFGFYGMIDEYIKSKKLRPFKNNFIDKKSSVRLFDKLFSSLSNYKYWFLSYNNNSYPTKEELLYIIGKYSKNIEVIEKPHIYKVTGKEKKQENTEYLFIIKNDKIS